MYQYFKRLREVCVAKKPSRVHWVGSLQFWNLTIPGFHWDWFTSEPVRPFERGRTTETTPGPEANIPVTHREATNYIFAQVECVSRFHRFTNQPSTLHTVYQWYIWDSTLGFQGIVMFFKKGNPQRGTCVGDTTDFLGNPTDRYTKPGIPGFAAVKS